MNLEKEALLIQQYGISEEEKEESEIGALREALWEIFLVANEGEIEDLSLVRIETPALIKLAKEGVDVMDEILTACLLGNHGLSLIEDEDDRHRIFADEDIPFGAL